MAKKVDFSDRLNKFQEKVSTETVTTHIQKVVPIKQGTKRKALDREAEKPFNVWLTKDTLKALKMKAAEEDISVKEIINKAIESYLG